MNLKVRRLFIFLFCIAFFIFSIVPALAQGIEIPKTKENTFVYDSEGVLSKEEAEDLNCILRYLESKTSVEFAVITTKSFNGMSMYDYAHDLFNELGIGKKDKDNGILLLFSANEGHAKLEFGYGLEHIFSEALSGRILDDYYVPNRDLNQPAVAISSIVNAVLEELGKEYGIELVKNQDEIIESIKSKDRIQRILRIIYIISLLLLLIHWILHPNSTSSRSGYNSSYHGGGFHSGGPFGGGLSGGTGRGR